MNIIWTNLLLNLRFGYSGSCQGTPGLFPVTESTTPLVSSLHLVGGQGSFYPFYKMGTKRDIQRETGSPIFTHLKRKTDWGFPYVLGPDTKQPNSQEILHLLARGAGSYRRHYICHCVVAHTKRPYAATLVFTPPDMSLRSDAGFPAQALLIANWL